MSAYVVHSSLAHDVEKCEVCIHVQSNDDWSDERSEIYLAFDIALHAQFNGDTLLSTNHTSPATDLIRGPPSFT